jgi:hypothetical protein
MLNKYSNNCTIYGYGRYRYRHPCCLFSAKETSHEFNWHQFLQGMFFEIFFKSFMFISDDFFLCFTLLPSSYSGSYPTVENCTVADPKFTSLCRIRIVYQLFEINVDYRLFYSGRILIIIKSSKNCVSVKKKF